MPGMKTTGMSEAGMGRAPAVRPEITISTSPGSAIIAPTRRSNGIKGGVMIKLLRNRTFVYGTALAAGIFGLGIGQSVLQKQAEAQGSTVQAPIFEVDPLWPKPLPNNWLLGWTIGIWVDELDHIWIIHRGAGGLHNNERGAELNPPIAECCRTAPPILVYDADGTLLRSWGGPGAGYEWPQSNHGVHVDYKGNVWIGGNGEKDAHILKFTNDGKFIMQVGHLGGNKGSNDLENFGRVAKIWVDPKSNEAYIADGYLNKRVAVLDADTGKMKRYWGAYGNKPDDTNLGPYDPKAPPAQQFRNPVHCIERSVDDLLYVCDRQNDRLQVFRPDGTFVKEQFFARNTKGAGAVWDIVFSKDPQQRFIMLADGQNERVRVIVRETLEEITSFGDGGRQPGQFYGVHSVASDSKGNLYTTETYEGKRVQKFNYKGIGSVPLGYQGVPWPKKS
jgi:DNA-binding beta-propeller fold protein YncE